MSTHESGHEDRAPPPDPPVGPGGSWPPPSWGPPVQGGEAPSAPQAWQPEPQPDLPPEARKPQGTIGWDILMGLNLGVVGLALLAVIVIYVLFLVVGLPGMEAGEPTEQELFWSKVLLWVNNVINLFLFGVIPFVWVMGTRVDPWRGTLRYLDLERPWPAVAHGFALAVVLAVLGLGLVLALDALDVPFYDMAGEDRFMVLDWALVIATVLIAGFAEEVFFRGILQKWIGIWGQAVVFSLMHIPNGWVGLLVTFLIGLLFGYLVKRGHSLWLVIVAHATYNFVLMSTELLFGPF